MAVTNLTGYTWKGSDDIDRLSNFNYSINFTSNSINYTSFNAYISIKYDNTTVYDIEDHYWLDENYRTVLFTGGDDVTNTTFISWLEANGTLTLPTPTYEVKFVTNGGTSVTKLEDVEELPTPLPTTTKTNNIFVGWFYDSEFEIQAFSGDTISSNITLYAKWYANMEDFYEDVANEIRIKNGETEPIKHTDFAYKIKNIQGGGLTVESWGTATKTLALSDANKLFVCGSIDNQTVTVPTNEAVPFPIGTMITFLLISNDKVTFVTGVSGVTLMSIDSLVELATPHGMVSLIKIFENAWQLVGALE